MPLAGRRSMSSSGTRRGLRGSGVRRAFLSNDYVYPGYPNGVQSWFRADLGVLTGAGAVAGNGDVVATWQDRGGSGRNLTQSTASFRPTYETGQTPAGGPVVHFDGVDNLMSVSYTRTQPRHIFGVISLVAAVNNGRIWEGDEVNRLALLQQTGTSWAAVSGSTLVDGAITVGAYVILAVGYNAASSQIRLNDGALTTGNAGSNFAFGLTLGAAAGGSLFSNVRIAEWLEYDSILSVGDESLVRDYLNARHSIF